MANEILYSGLSDQRVAEYLSTQTLLLFADRNALPNHPVIAQGFAGDIQGKGSTVVKLAQLGFYGYDGLTAVAENTAAPETALTDGNVSVTVARHAKAYNNSGLAAMTDSLGFVSAESTFIRDTVISAQMNLVELIANIADGFTATETPGTGVDLDLATLIRAAIQLQVADAPVDMGLLWIGHTQQWGDVHLELLTSAAGAVQWAPATQEQLAVRGSGYKGQFFGMDIFTTNKVPTINAGADRAGALMAPGALAWAVGTPVADGDADKLTLGAGVQYARAFDNSTDMKKHVMNHFAGVSKGIEAGGVTTFSDA